MAHIGARMGLKDLDSSARPICVLKEAPSIESSLLTQLPLNYDSTTLKTIEYIDVLWLKGRSMAPRLRSRAHHRDLLRKSSLLPVVTG